MVKDEESKNCGRDKKDEGKFIKLNEYIADQKTGGKKNISGLAHRKLSGRTMIC
jgi:hypothetical protein